MKALNVLLSVATMLLSSGVLADVDKNVEMVRFIQGTHKATAEKLIQNAGYEVRYYHAGTNIYSVAPVDRKNLNRKSLQKSLEVLYIEPVVERKIVSNNTLLNPNDSLFNQQRGMKNFGVQRAWDISTGSNEIVVAVTDTGVNLSHVDLIHRLWINPGEISGNGRDDDGNGFVDDVYGWDFANDDNNPDDDHYHGSHVAGIIGAHGNNGKGIAGVNWNVRIMAVKFLKASGSGTSEAATKSILYAADNGAHIINASWGSTSESKAELDAIRYAAAKGVLFVAAAGNADKNTDKTDFFPANSDSPNVISVGAASTSAQAKASFSNYGATTVDVFAPGEKILSTVDSDQSYRTLSGTSMAAPMVAGLSALMLSHTDLNMLELRNGILNSTITRSAFVNRSAAQGFASAEKGMVQLLAGPQIWPGKYRLKVGTSLQLSTFKLTGNIQWSSSNEKIATISGSGEVTALNEGEVTISATNGTSTLTTESFLVVGKKEGGGGCSRVEGQEEDVSIASLSPLMVLCLPLFSVILFRRREEN